jgi:hypothetical protein
MDFHRQVRLLFLFIYYFIYLFFISSKDLSNSEKINNYLKQISTLTDELKKVFIIFSSSLRFIILNRK